MSVQVEKLEENMAKLTIELSTEQFEDAMEKAFNKSKSKLNIPDFRRGKVPHAMTGKTYGEGIFYEEAVDEAINATCVEAMNESGLETASRPEVAVEQIGEDKPFIYTVTVAVRPEVTLGEYKDIEMEKVGVTMKPEDVEIELKKAQEQNARFLTVKDRSVADGSQTVIDLEGFVGGKTLDGGKAADYPLAIGFYSFTDTFEEQPIGKNIGEECEINITFPEEHHAAKLAGKPTTLKVAAEAVPYTYPRAHET